MIISFYIKRTEKKENKFNALLPVKIASVLPGPLSEHTIELTQRT